jgi:hypothetical protein
LARLGGLDALLERGARLDRLLRQQVVEIEPGHHEAERGKRANARPGQSIWKPPVP